MLKDKKKDLVSQRNRVNLEHEVVKTKIFSLEVQNKELEAVLQGHKKLSTRCGKLTEQAKLSKKELECKANDYQALKEAAGSFLLWTEALQHRAELLEDFDDGDHLPFKVQAAGSERNLPAAAGFAFGWEVGS